MDPRVQTLLRRPNLTQRSPEWYEAREHLITASDAAAALDIKPYEKFSKSARAELLKKKCGLTAPFSSPFMAHGVKYEDEARRIYEEKTGEEVLEFGLLIHPVLTWLGASPDGVTKSGKVVEIKCPVSRPILPDMIPEHYYPQVQICLEVCDMEEAVFIQYKPEDVTWPKPGQFTVHTVPRSREWFEENREKLHDFWKEMMEAKERTRAAPPPTPKPPPPVPPPQTENKVACAIVDDLYPDDAPLDEQTIGELFSEAISNLWTPC
jgi:putative phage-type endonuclease